MKKAITTSLFILCSTVTGVAINQPSNNKSARIIWTDDSNHMQIEGNFTYTMNQNGDEKAALNALYCCVLKTPSYNKFIQNHYKTTDKVSISDSQVTEACKKIGKEYGMHISTAVLKATGGLPHETIIFLEPLNHNLILKSKKPLSKEEVEKLTKAILNIFKETKKFEQMHEAFGIVDFNLAK